MRTTTKLVGLMLFLTASAVAQEVPRIEVFGGYSHLIANVNGTSSNFNGVSVAVGENVNRWFGGALDFTGHWGTQAGFRVNTQTLMYGPVFSYRGLPNITPSGHVLLGFVHGSPGYLGVSQSDRVFGAMLGGSVDVGFTRNVAIRVIQADYLFSHFFKTRQDNIRLSAGVVLRFGGR